jgi:hypothetical protein
MMSIVSCEPPVSISLDAEDQTLVDSLYLQAAKEYNLKFDSICSAYKATEYPALRDSIEQVRLQEISQMLEL